MLTKYVRIAKFAEVTGYSAKAIYNKINEGVWLERREFRRAPDGAILVDMEGYERWVQGDAAPPSRR